MKKQYFIPLFIVTLTTLLLLTFLNPAHAKRALLQPGTIEEHFSENKNYRIEIKYLGEHPDKIVEATLYEKNIKKWQKFYPVHPGLINVSDDGSRIAFANWGWYDEGGFKSLTICDGQGNVLKELTFSEIQESERGYKGYMLWLRDSAISSSGDYYAMGAYGKEKAGIYLLDIKKMTFLWQQACGYERLEDIKVFDNGIVLVATSDYPSGKLSFSVLNNLGQVLWEKGCSWRINYAVANYLKIKGDSFGILNTLDNDFIALQVRDGNIYPRNEFLIYEGGVGAIKCGMSIESLYFLYPYSIIKLLDLHADGLFSPFIGIYFEGNHPSLLAELGWNNEKGWIVNRIWAYDPRFKTETGVAVNSTLGDAKKTNVISWIISNENRDVIGYIQKLQIVFLLESSNIPEKFYKNHEVSLVPEDAKILAIGTTSKGKTFSCHNFFPKLPLRFLIAPK
ncbi:MAG: hypothetical protein KAS69_06380 [Planctomycetes bacterium]|nr:hypothetical protein [Planctomycetota bacterium]